MASTTNVSASAPKVGGSISMAAVGSTLPTDASGSLDEAFKNLGYLSDDGIKNSNSPDVETKQAWGGDTVLTTLKAKKDEWKFTLIEALNEDVLKLVYGEANVTTSGGIKVSAKAENPQPHAFVVDMVLNGKVKRVVLPKATLTDLGDIEYKDDDTVGYEVTLTALPDDTGHTHYEYIA